MQIYLALEGPARQACSNIHAKELHSENEVKIIIEKLKSLYEKMSIKQVLWHMKILKIYKTREYVNFGLH